VCECECVEICLFTTESYCGDSFFWNGIKFRFEAINSSVWNFKLILVKLSFNTDFEFFLHLCFTVLPPVFLLPWCVCVCVSVRVSIQHNRSQSIPHWGVSGNFFQNWKCVSVISDSCKTKVWPDVCVCVCVSSISAQLGLSVGQTGEIWDVFQGRFRKCVCAKAFFPSYPPSGVMISLVDFFMLGGVVLILSSANLLSVWVCECASQLMSAILPTFLMSYPQRNQYKIQLREPAGRLSNGLIQ